MPPPLGWIRPQDRTDAQERAHAAAVAAMPRFAIGTGGVAPAGPVKVMLTDFWKRPEVVKDVGFEFTGFHQVTGSCVGASAGNAIFTLAAVQRMLTLGATQAFCPWWPFDYGRTRFNEGDRGQGEGAIDSVMAQTLKQEGVIAATEQGLPTFDHADGLTLTEHVEMQWSDGNSGTVKKWLDAARVHPLGTAAPVNSVEEVKQAVVNGYPVLDGCDLYVGHGRVQGSGDSAAAVGEYDGRGGHSTCVLGYWDNPELGPLYAYSNQWPSSTYPKDPGGLGRCCVWLKEATMAKLFTLGGRGESFALSHLAWFPSQSEQILNWLM